MTTLKPYENDALNLVQKVQNGDVRVEDVVEFYWQRSVHLNKSLNSLVHLERSSLDEQARSIQKRLNQGEVLPLAGLPIAIKDNICTKNEPTTCGSKFLEGFNPIYDATVITKLKEAGALLFGKANMDEFGMGSSNEHSHYGVTRNPWDLAKVPGGSSGGSAASVAADMVPASLGSDTGGSVRQPASFCGIVGYKPSYGAVSRYGLVSYASSLDQIGPMARSSKEAALIASVICSFDEQDPTSNKNYSFHRMHPNEWTDFSWQGKRIGLVRELMSAPQPAREVQQKIDEVIQLLCGLGAEVIDISIPEIKTSIAVYYVIAAAEASANLARFDGVRFGRRTETCKTLNELYKKSRSEGFGQEVKQRIMLGTFTLASGYYDAYYAKAKAVQVQLIRSLQRAFDDCDFIISPTSPTTAFNLGEKTSDPLSMYLNDAYTVFVNLTGVPAVSFPCGFSQEGMPIGVQLVGPHGYDRELLQGADAYEKATSWWQSRQPKL